MVGGYDRLSQSTAGNDAVATREKDEPFSTVVRTSRINLFATIVLIFVTIFAFSLIGGRVSHIESDQQSVKAALWVCNYLPQGEKIPVDKVPVLVEGETQDAYAISYNFVYTDTYSKWSRLADAYGVRGSGFYRIRANFIVDFAGDDNGLVVAGIYGTADLSGALNETGSGSSYGRQVISFDTRVITPKDVNAELYYSGSVDEDTRLFVAAFQIRGTKAVFRDLYDCGSNSFSAVYIR